MSRTSEEHTFTTWDGTELFYRSWAPITESNKALILIHRGHEHSGRVQELQETLDLPDFWAFSWDNRGHGKSPGERGHAPSYMALVRDLDAFVQHVCCKHGVPIENVSIVANSVGAVTAATWVHDYAPRIRCMVLAAPAFRIKLYVPLAIPMLRQLLKIKPNAVIHSYVKSKMLTHDEEQSRAYDEDELITRDIAVNVLLGLHDTSTRILADAGAIVAPTLILSGGSDCVVKNKAHRRFYKALSSNTKQMSLYPGFYHALLYEKDRCKPIADARKFILRSFGCDVERSILLRADQGGYTRAEYDLLRQPAPPFKNLVYKLQTIGMRTVGRLSNGVCVGCETGFDSGLSLDYVYDNEARGTSFLGRLIDRGYLNAIGWRGIRKRRVHLVSMLKNAMKDRLDAGKPVHVLDLATGCGRYVLDVLKELGSKDVSALLRDWDQRNLEQVTQCVKALGVENVECEQGDAFDKESILSVAKKPDIVIVSGLYELFSDNEMVRSSLEGIAGILADDGVLIYTGQPWHPQVEMIARTLTNRENEPWIMRRRTQVEMDELVRSVGLTKEAMLIDDDGIFTVSSASRR